MLYMVPKRKTPVVAKPKAIVDISADELRRLQEHDSTLANIRQIQSCDIAASTSESSGREQEIFVSENSCQ